jgi:hypothetical protein
MAGGSISRVLSGKNLVGSYGPPPTRGTIPVFTIRCYLRSGDMEAVTWQPILIIGPLSSFWRPLGVPGSTEATVISTESLPPEGAIERNKSLSAVGIPPVDQNPQRAEPHASGTFKCRRVLLSHSTYTVPSGVDQIGLQLRKRGLPRADQRHARRALQATTSLPPPQSLPRSTHS